MEHTLRITYGTSRGRDTYGYTLVTLKEQGRKTFRASGGGYDMRGTVFGEWLADTYQTRLMTVKERFTYRVKDGGGVRRVEPEQKDHLYGGYWYEDDKRVSLDGACGFDSMRRIAEAIGLKVQKIDASKNVDVILVSDGPVF